MERSSFFDEPTDEEINALLDGDGPAAADRDDDDFATTEPPADADDEDLAGDDAGGEDAAGDDEDEDGEDEGDDEPPADPRVAELERQLSELQERETERQAEAQRVTTANLLLAVKARMTDAEWEAFSAKMVADYKDHQIAALMAERDERVRAEQMTAFETAEAEAFDGIMAHVGRELGGLLPAEELALRNCANATQFHTTLEKLIDARRGMTEPARRALRERRRASGADRPGVRAAGGARQPSRTDDYDGLTPEEAMDRHFDEVVTGRA